MAYAYDNLGRMASQTVTTGSAANTAAYTYAAGGHGEGSTTNLVETIAQTGGNFTYTYDDNGNIVRVVQDGVETAYTYDGLGQLIRVDDGQENATWVYEYDQGGNILSKKRYALGTTTGEPLESKVFTYGNANWKDQLTAVDGVAITYDQIGNPTQYGANTDSDKITFEWEKGRQLKKMVKPGETVEFKYNENGLRIQKVATSTGTTNYTLHGKNIVHMTQGSNELHFFYDAQNKPAVVVYNGSPYSYVKNLQGDIVAILDSNKNVVVSYVYDAWGRPISCLGTMANTLGKINPFRYRGYVYDEETELYYLQSRYFSTACCRFISVDGLIDATRLLSLNQFAYCLNQPVNLSDPTGFAAPDDFDDDLDHNSPCTDSLAGGGGYLWDSFRRSLQAATDGLNMAMGKRNLPSLEKHHLLSNKNRKYTPQYEDVVNRYEMSLDDERNIVELPDHKGRHTNAYHDYMLDMLTELDSIANGSNELFYEGFDILKRFIVDNPWLPYAK